MSATHDGCTSQGEALAFARAHGLVDRVDLEAIAEILENRAADVRTARLLALGFCAGYAARQEEDAASD
jgi:hypothetical protein